MSASRGGGAREVGKDARRNSRRDEVHRESVRGEGEGGRNGSLNI